jgi:hypothetical protein
MIRYSLMSRLVSQSRWCGWRARSRTRIGLRHLGSLQRLLDRTFALTGARASVPPDLTYVGPRTTATVPDCSSRSSPFTVTSTFAARRWTTPARRAGSPTLPERVAVLEHRPVSEPRRAESTIPARAVTTTVASEGTSYSWPLSSRSWLRSVES